MSGFQIVWPERRYVSEKQIRVWYSDAIENGEIDKPGCEPGVVEMALALSGAGLITLGNRRPI